MTTGDSQREAERSKDDCSELSNSESGDESGIGVVTIAIVVFTPLVLLLVLSSGTPESKGVTPVKPDTAEIESGLITNSSKLDESEIIVTYNSSYEVSDVEYEIKNPYYDGLGTMGRKTINLVPEQRVFKLPYHYSPGILEDRFKGSSGIKYYLYYKNGSEYISNETITLKNTTSPVCNEYYCDKK